MGGKYILAFDQGTTSSRSILFDHDGGIIASAQQEFTQIFPHPGWVEHNPKEILESQVSTAKAVMKRAGVSAEDIAAIGITNQRETAVAWNRRTGEPVHNAIVWQCRRTTDLCEKLKADGHEETFQQRTGLLVDAYFSGTKFAWYLENVPEARKLADQGDLCFGTVDSWLLYNLTGQHATDYTNASRTLIYNIHDLAWDDTLLDILGIPKDTLPEVFPTSNVFGTTTLFGGEIPVASVVGDQQGALFGQTAFDVNDAKNTYGTGCFLLVNTGEKAIPSRQGLLTTIAWGLDGKVTYALEGSIFTAGAVIQWLRDELHLIGTAAESETVAAQVPDTAGVYLVPAFVGLGAPYWDMRARGTITGLTRGSGRAHIVRAALESISYQSADLAHTMERETGRALAELRVDGGATANNLMMQHQADLLGVPVLRGQVIETTALGAAYFAGLAVGFWKNKDELRTIWKEERRFTPSWSDSDREKALAGWKMAVRRTRSELK
jgi:glycerol kinase